MKDLTEEFKVHTGLMNESKNISKTFKAISGIKRVELLSNSRTATQMNSNLKQT